MEGDGETWKCCKLFLYLEDKWVYRCSGFYSDVRYLGNVEAIVKERKFDVMKCKRQSPKSHSVLHRGLSGEHS